jgi:hypothetical protein
MGTTGVQLYLFLLGIVHRRLKCTVDGRLIIQEHPEGLLVGFKNLLILVCHGAKPSRKGPN